MHAAEACPTHASNCAVFVMLQLLVVFLQHAVLCAAPLYISLPPNALVQIVPNATQARSPSLLYEPALSSSTSGFFGAHKKGQWCLQLLLGLGHTADTVAIVIETDFQVGEFTESFQRGASSH